MVLACSIRATEVTPRASMWANAEHLAKNAVVQIIVQRNPFNWIEPYKSPIESGGAGSGFFISEKGDILTNFHVVEQASKIEIFIPAMGQQPLEAEIVGVCPDADVALIRLKERSLSLLKKVLKKVPYLILGDSDTLFPTEPVLAIGYPNGQRYVKCTSGVVAGKDYIGGKSFMHITAPINPGNSGGPLLNLEGKVVGINSAVMTGLQNIGYIVPIFDVQILLEDLKKNRLVLKPHPGIRYNRATKEHTESLGNPFPAGVYIHTVEPGSSADKAGVQAGDMLYQINGLQVDSYGDVTVNLPSSVKISLDEYLLRQPSHAELRFELYRKGQKKSLVCRDISSPCCMIRNVYPDYEPDEVEYEVIGGMCVMQLRLNHIHTFPDMARLQQYRRHVKKHKKILIVTNIIPGSVFCQTKVVYQGALLDTVNGQKVSTLDDLRKALRASVDSGYITVKTKFGTTTAVSLDKVLEDEERLTKKHQFTSTGIINDLKNNVVKSRDCATIKTCGAAVPMR